MATKTASPAKASKSKSKKSQKPGTKERKTSAKAKKPAKSGKKPAVNAEKSAPKPKKTNWESRAVLRLIEAGAASECPACGEPIKFRARHRDMQVICNIYEKSVWKRVEQYHEECYKNLKEPYGKAIKVPKPTKGSRKPASK